MLVKLYYQLTKRLCDGKDNNNRNHVWAKSGEFPAKDITVGSYRCIRCGKTKNGWG